MKITYKLEEGCIYNVGITINGYLVSDTNDSQNWKRCVIKLPEGKWKKYTQEKELVTLVK